MKWGNKDTQKRVRLEVTKVPKVEIALDVQDFLYNFSHFRSLIILDT